MKYTIYSDKLRGGPDTFDMGTVVWLSRKNLLTKLFHQTKGNLKYELQY